MIIIMLKNEEKGDHHIILISWFRGASQEHPQFQKCLLEKSIVSKLCYHISLNFITPSDVSSLHTCIMVWTELCLPEIHVEALISEVIWRWNLWEELSLDVRWAPQSGISAHIRKATRKIFFPLSLPLSLSHVGTQWEDGWSSSQKRRSSLETDP